MVIITISTSGQEKTKTMDKKWRKMIGKRVKGSKRKLRYGEITSSLVMMGKKEWERVYRENGYSLHRISKEYGELKETIGNVLRYLGIDIILSMKTGRKVEIECKWCKKKLMRIESEVKKHNGGYCSRRCIMFSSRKKRAEREARERERRKEGVKNE